jgi:DNA-binding transcriptional LysR family regulator
VPDGAQLLLRDDFRAVMRADHPLAGERYLRLEDLEDDEFLLSEGGCEPYVRRLHAMAGSRFVPPRAVKGFATLLEMVGAGIGVSIVPGATKVMLPPETVLVPLRPTVHRELYLTGPANRAWLPAVDVLVRSALS